MILIAIIILSWTEHKWTKVKAKQKTKIDQIIGPREALKPKVYNLITKKRRSELQKRMWTQQIIHFLKTINKDSLWFWLYKHYN